jgi:hypothetical protein
MLEEAEVRGFLSKLCVELGICIPPAAADELSKCPPSDAFAFVVAVFVAEGMEPEMVDRKLYRRVRDMASLLYSTSKGRKA